MKLKRIALGAVLGGLLGIPSAFSQGWKYDLNFQDGGSGDKQTYTAAIDSEDKVYTLEREQDPSPGVIGYRLMLRQYNADGTSGFSFNMGPSPNHVVPHGHHGGGVEVDENYVYVTTEYLPINGNIGGARIRRIDKNNPSNPVQDFGQILGWCQMTDLEIHGDYLYAYGYLGAGYSHTTEFGPTSADFISPYHGNGYQNTAFLVKYNRITMAFEWVKQVSDLGAMTATDMEIDDQGNIYLAAACGNGTKIGIANSHVVNYNTIAATAGVVVRYTSDGNYDASFTPITRFIPNPLSTLYKDFVDDVKKDPVTNHIYIGSMDNIAKYEVSNSNKVWERNIPNMSSAVLAVGTCPTMYVTAKKIVFNGPVSTYTYFAQSLDKNSGVLTNSLVSAPYGNLKNSDGEVIFIQSDGDKVIIGDYNHVGAQPIAIDYNPAQPNPNGVNTYSGNSYRGSFVGIYDDGVKGTLVSDFILKDAQGDEKYTFLCGEEIIFDGTSSLNETNHFIDLWSRPAGSQGNFTKFQGFGGWQGGQANVKNFTQMIANHGGINLQPGVEYQIKLAVQNECLVWLEKLVTFTVQAATLNAAFTSVNTNTTATSFDLIATSSNNPAGALHLWYIWDPAAGALVSISGWTTSSTHTFNGLPRGKTFVLIHVVRDPHGCAANQNASHFVGQKSNNSTVGTEEFSEEMLAILDDVDHGKFDHLMNKRLDVLMPEIQLFPNPAEVQAIIINQSDVAAKVTLTNIAGQTIANYDLTSHAREELDLRSLNTGVYLVHVQFEDGTEVIERLVKR